MVKLINRRLEKEYQKERQKKLSDIIDSEIKGSCLMRSYPIPSDLGHYLLFNKSTPLPKQDVMEILDGVGVITIDVKNNNYLNLAKSIGNKIENGYAEEYEKEVTIKYTD